MTDPKMTDPKTKTNTKTNINLNTNTKTNTNKKPIFKTSNYKSISDREDATTSWWQKNKTFEKSIENRPEDNPYSFLDGPPFVTGIPHYGSLLPRIAKDVVPRYQTMKGKRVRRVWGWDCHGLPIEEKVEARLGLKNRREIEKYGINKYLEACRTYVEETSSEWKWYIDKIGEWIDFDGAYYTMHKDYMESVIWVFKTLYEKGLVYHGTKTLLYCTRCGTPVSKFEIAMDNSYKNVKDPSIVVEFPVKTSGKFKDQRFVAWTTTPWTIPSNRALAVDPKEKYVTFTQKSSDKKYILAQKRLKHIVKEDEVEILDEFKGKELEGLEYEAPFGYFPPNKKDLHVYTYPGMVNMEEGTGVVHSAPGYGEIDTDMGRELGLTEMFAVDDEGKFIDKVKDYSGQYIKKADEEIIEDLKKMGVLFSSGTVTHRYPYCYRCEKPLIYRSVPSWFVDIQKIKKQLLEQNEKINWIPEKFKHGRVENTIETAPDWGISRTRYWATIIPIWKCDKCKALEVFGSIKEIEGRSGEKVSGLHRNDVDHIEFPCQKCSGNMKRIPEVLDCWLESGSMPYGQIHYPFENEKLFKQTFPADYIIEYVAQIRAWFYYMHVIANAVTGENSYKNVVTTGVLFGTDGRKMSKLFGNYPDPRETLIKYGGDALRLYFMASPIMVGEDMNFNEEDLKAQVTTVIFPFYNSFKYLTTYANIHGWQPADLNWPKAGNILDKWVLVRLKEFKKEVGKNLDNYNMPNAVRKLEPFVSDLSTWFIRRSRDRFMSGDTDAIKVLYFVLVETAKIMAPIIPFVTEEIFQRLVSDINENGPKSVHLCDWPEAHEYEEISKEDEKLLEDMREVRQIASLGQAARIEAKKKLRQPLSEVHVSGTEFDDELINIVKDELNVAKVKLVKKVKEAKGWFVQKDRELQVALNANMTNQLKEEGDYRELIRMLQDARKKAGLEMGEIVKMSYATSDTKLISLIKKREKRIKKDVSVASVVLSKNPDEAWPQLKVNDSDLKVSFDK